MNCIVTGGAGFIGSHLVDRLVSLGHSVMVYDNLLCGSIANINNDADFCYCDLSAETFGFHNTDVVFHCAALARTPWCIDDPVKCYKNNVMATINVLQEARRCKVKRVVLSSSNVVYAFDTPYRTSKEAVERLGDVYSKMYGQSVIALRYSNVYGPRQSEDGPAPNVFAALRKSKKENGYLTITGDGEQTRDYTHVYDIVEGNIKAVSSEFCGTVDLCTGVNTSLNEVAKYFECPIKYVPERPGDVKHIIQDPGPAKSILGWVAKVKLEEGIKDVL